MTVHILLVLLGLIPGGIGWLLVSGADNSDAEAAMIPLMLAGFLLTAIIELVLVVTFIGMWLT